MTDLEAALEALSQATDRVIRTTRATISAANSLSGGLDDLNTIGQAAQLKLQALTEERNEALEALSDLMNAVNDATKKIVDNLT